MFEIERYNSDDIIERELIGTPVMQPSVLKVLPPQNVSKPHVRVSYEILPGADVTL